MLPWEAINGELLRQENKILAKRTATLDAQLRASEQKHRTLQANVDQLEQANARLSDPCHGLKANADVSELATLKNECADFEEFLTSYCSSVNTDEVSTLSVDYKRALEVADQLRLQKEEMNCHMQTLSVRVQETESQSASHSKQATDAQVKVAALQGQVKDLDDEVRRTRSQCEALKVQLQDERQKCRKLEQGRHQSTNRYLLHQQSSVFKCALLSRCWLFFRPTAAAEEKTSQVERALPCEPVQSALSHRSVACPTRGYSCDRSRRCCYRDQCPCSSSRSNRCASPDRTLPAVRRALLRTYGRSARTLHCTSTAPYEVALRELSLT
jgi:DNA repair exonuclease SbcCD ATPase subunit